MEARLDQSQSDLGACKAELEKKLGKFFDDYLF